ncbi:MAG: fibronectin type III domain-containing protein [Treponema sp.]|jgi:hypothetical protein|nr:fibronectin type III domain-containing protein [Treponema sp.]
MKKMVLSLAALLLMTGSIAFGQEQELPRLAVVEFTSNISTEKTKADSLTVRNLVESQMVATGRYQIVTRSEIDQLLNNQQIAISSISSAENVKKLQLQNISYIVTGSVDAMDTDYAVTVKILDVSTGQFSHSANDFMGGSSRELYTGVNALTASFVKGMSAEGGQVAQAGSQRPRSGPSAAGIGIEVSTVLGGALYFEGEEIAALWDNDTHTIPIERPGVYKIRIVFGNGRETSRDVTITSRGVVKEAFLSPPPPPPGNVRAGNITLNAIELNWTSAGQGISYRVYSSTTNNPAEAGLAGTTAGTSYRAGNLRPGTEYYFWVSAQEGTLEGAKGQTVMARTSNYTVGSPGPGGGIVFYDKGNFSDGWRFLEAAPASAEFKAELGGIISVSGTNTGIGSGKRNTEIIAGRGRAGAQRCAALNTGGYRDWFLPSKDELNLMYQNLKRKGLGGFSDAWYESSSGYFSNIEWFQRFSDGAQGLYETSDTFSVRAVRAF